MKLTPAHKALIKLLAAAAVDEFLEEPQNLLHQTKEEPMERKKERDHAPRTHSN